MSQHRSRRRVVRQAMNRGRGLAADRRRRLAVTDRHDPIDPELSERPGTTSRFVRRRDRPRRNRAGLARGRSGSALLHGPLAVEPPGLPGVLGPEHDELHGLLLLVRLRARGWRPARRRAGRCSSPPRGRRRSGTAADDPSLLGCTVIWTPGSRLPMASFRSVYCLWMSPSHFIACELGARQGDGHGGVHVELS